MLRFSPIDQKANLEDALRFREDAFVCSFGDSSQFIRDKYIAWLNKLQQTSPESALHVWLGNRLIGQLEMGVFKDKPGAGYVHLYYLIPEERGKGHAVKLDDYAMAYMKTKGFRSVWLSVGTTNLRAIRFYTRLGWVDRGPRPDLSSTHYMERLIP